MKNNTKTQIEKLTSEMAEKHDYLQALESTLNAAADFTDVCLNVYEQNKLTRFIIVPDAFLSKLVRLELNLRLLHQTYLYGSEEEFEEVMRNTMKMVALKEKISLED